MRHCQISICLAFPAATPYTGLLESGTLTCFGKSFYKLEVPLRPLRHCFLYLHEGVSTSCTSDTNLPYLELSPCGFSTPPSISHSHFITCNLCSTVDKCSPWGTFWDLFCSFVVLKCAHLAMFVELEFHSALLHCFWCQVFSLLKRK